MTGALLPQIKHAELDEGIACLSKSALNIVNRLPSQTLSTDCILFAHVVCSFDFISSVSSSQAAMQSSSDSEHNLHV
jgi:hypothetical protein